MVAIYYQQDSCEWILKAYECNVHCMPISKRRRKSLPSINTPTEDYFSSILNRDLKKRIFSEFSILDLLQLCLVCKEWNHLIKSYSELFSSELSFRNRNKVTDQIIEKTLLNGMVNLAFSALDLAGCWEISPTMLESLLASNKRTLLRLDLSGCTNINDAVAINNIGLYLNKLTHFTNVNNNYHYISTSLIIDCRLSLIELDISKNGYIFNFKPFKIEFPNLKTLKIRWYLLNEMHLVSIHHHCPKLSQLDLSFCLLNGPSKTIPLLDYIPTLEKVIAIGASKDLYPIQFSGGIMEMVTGDITIDNCKQLILDNNFPIDCCYKIQSYPTPVNLITHSILAGNINLLQWLLDHGANTNTFVNRSQTALLCTIFLYYKSSSLESNRYYLYIIKMLLEYGATPELQCSESPLYLACKSENINLIKLLLDYGANASTDGSKCLTQILNQQILRDDIADLLFMNGAFLSIYAFGYQSTSIHQDTIHYLMDKARYNKEYVSPSRLVYAAINGKKKQLVSNLLIEFEDDLFCKVKSRDYIWTENCKSNKRVDEPNLSVIHDLLKEGYFPDFTEIDENGDTWLHRNIHQVSSHTLIIALENGTPINSRNNMGNTIAHKLLENRSMHSLQKIKIIERYGFDFSIVNNDNQSILFYEMNHFDQSLFKYVLSICNDVDIIDKDGNSPLMIAAKNRDRYRMNKILKKGANPSLIHHQDKKKMLILHYLINEFDDNEFSIYFTLIKLLIDYGSDCNIKDDDGNTPCHISACKGLVDVLILLIQVDDTDIFIPDRNGKTAIELYREWKYNKDGEDGYHELIKLSNGFDDITAMRIQCKLHMHNDNVKKR